MEDLQGIGETERGCVGRWILNKKREFKNRKSKKCGKDKSLNIAVLGHKRIPSREGGIEVVVEELSTRMVREGNQVTCSVCASFAAAFGNYDIVHIHGEGSALMCWLPKIMGKKVVMTVHGAAVIIGTSGFSRRMA